MKRQSVQLLHDGLVPNRLAPNRFARTLLGLLVGFALLLAPLGPCSISQNRAFAASKRDKLLRLLKRRPSGMSPDRWRSQRREAARELGRLHERRAVPILLSIVAKERFDVLLEIAIEALGKIGDKRAIGPLKRLMDDPSLDAYVRDAVGTALKRLGHARSSRPPRKVIRTTTRTGNKPQPDPPVKKINRYRFEALPPLQLPDINASLIAKRDQLELAATSGQFLWDGAADRTQGGLDIATRYRIQVEARRLSYSIDASASLGLRLDDPPGDDRTTWDFNHTLQFNPEVRYYPFSNDLPLLFGQAIVSLGYGLALARPAASADEKRFAFASTLNTAFAVGYGRKYDIGARLRVNDSPGC
jgi:hypothetical protein